MLTKTSELTVNSNSRNWLKLVLIVVIVLGIFFRFVNLSKKVYWYDEAHTSLWVAGYTPQELKQNLFTGQLLTAADLQKYQHHKPDQNVMNTIDVLARYDNQHPPLYYLIVRLWTELFGDSISSIRGISVILSLFALPLAYWFGCELFQSNLSAWMLTGLVAIAPFQLLYAQEAREYGLSIAFTFLSSAVLLRAIRQPTRASWGLYTLSLALGLYTSLFTVLIMVSHGMYLLAMQRFKLSKIVLNYCMSTVISCVLFIPWILVILNNPVARQGLGWTKQPLPIPALINMWLNNTSRTIFDINLPMDESPLSRAIQVLTLALIGYSIVFLWCKAPNRIRLFILLMGGFTALSLMAPDLIIGGRRSSAYRYWIPTWLSIQLALAYWLGSIFENQRRSFIVLQKTAIFLVLTAGLSSGLAMAQADTWWIKKPSDQNPKIAQIINQVDHPLLVSSNYRLNPGELLSLSHLLKADVKLLLVQDPVVPKIPAGFKHTFLFNPSNKMRRGIETTGHSAKLLLEHRSGSLWQIDS